ncbi:MAG: hypothetical protein ACM3YO_00475, partial [Bacteroidota bacterium]
IRSILFLIILSGLAFTGGQPARFHFDPSNPWSWLFGGLLLGAFLLLLGLNLLQGLKKIEKPKDL